MVSWRTLFKPTKAPVAKSRPASLEGKPTSSEITSVSSRTPPNPEPPAETPQQRAPSPIKALVIDSPVETPRESTPEPESPSEAALVPWERPSRKKHDFKFLRTDIFQQRAALGVWELHRGQFTHEAYLFHTGVTAMVYRPNRKVVEEYPYEKKPDEMDLIQHSLSPDGKTLIRFMKDAATSEWDAFAIDTASKRVTGHVTKFGKITLNDALRPTWIGNSTIFITEIDAKRVHRWALGEETTTTIRPLSAVSNHVYLEFTATKDETWWAAWGTSLRGEVWGGNVEIHDVQLNESKVLSGQAVCLTEAKVYDVDKALIVIADIAADGRLAISIQQLNPRQAGEPFQPVEVSVDLLKTLDTPQTITTLEPLPIVAVSTRKHCLYFFELHTGTYLYSQDMEPQVSYIMVNSTKYKMLGYWCLNANHYKLFSINEKDLIGYVRQVLKNDTLASAIAIRAGLPGADDVVLDDMYRPYRHLSYMSGSSYMGGTPAKPKS